MSWPFEIGMALHLASSEGAAASLPAEADVLVVAEGSLRPLELVEDEIILALPLVPRHPDGVECAGTAGAPSAPEPEKRANPFSVLRNLKI
jgi:uncharacterized protein